MPSRALGVAKIWDGGCGVDTSWSCANNWNDNVAPLAADTLTFNGTSTNNSTIDASFGGVIASVTISSGYTGTITMARSLQITGNYSQAAGSFTAADQNLDMNGSFTLSAGNFTASSTATSLAGGMTVSGSPSFTHNGGTWTFDGGSATLSCGSVAFNVVVIANTSTTAKVIQSNCSLPLGNNPTVGNAITVNGTLSGTGTLTVTTGTVTISNANPLSGFTGLVVNGALTVTGASNHLNLSSYTSVDVNGAFTLSTSAIFTASTGSMNFANTFNLTSGTTFNHSSGTLILDGGSATITCNGAIFNSVVFSNTSTKTVSSGCDLPIGNNPSLPNNVTVSGTLTGSGTLTHSAGTLTISSTNPLVGFSAFVANSSVTVTGSGNHLNLNGYTTVDLNSGFTLSSSATFTAPASTMTASTMTLNSGTTFNHNNGTVNFDVGGGTITCTGSPFNLALFTSVSAKTIATGCDVKVGTNPTISLGLTVTGSLSGTGNLTFSSGTLTMNAGGGLSGFSTLTVSSLTVNGTGTVNLSALTSIDVNSAFTLSSPAVFSAPPNMTVAGNITLNAGATFTHNNGTVTLDSGNGTVTCNGISLYQVVFGSTTSNTTKTIASSCNLPLGANPTIPGPGVVTVQGVLSGSGTLTSAVTLTLNNAASNFSGFTTVAPSSLTVSGNVAVDLSGSPTLDIANNFTISTSGTSFTAPAYMYVGGNFTVNTGTTFNHNNGTVEFDGENPSVLAPVTFYNLKKINSDAPGGFQFTAGITVTVAGSLTLKGTPSYFLGLTSTNASTWSIDPQGARDVEYVSVYGSNNISASPIEASNSLDNSVNTNWTFTPPASSSGNHIDFADATADSGLNTHMVGVYSHGASWGDANGDEYPDLFVGGYGTSVRPDGEEVAPNQLLLGGAGGSFTLSDQTHLEVFMQTNGVLFVDLDNDSDQDLLVVAQYRPGHATPKIAEEHRLYRNLGGGSFEDISVASGIRTAGPARNGRTASALDYNNDGFMDLVIHADALVGGAGTMKLVKNNGDMTFSDVTAETGLPTNLSGLGLAVGDANGDSWPDLLLSGGVFGDPDTTTGEYRRFYIYINDHDGTFHDATPDGMDWDDQGIGHDDWTTGGAWTDFNRDGRLDLVTTHHFESAYRVSPLGPRIFMNRGNDVAGDPILEMLPVSTLLPVASKLPHLELEDFDNDGWVDVFVSVMTRTGSTDRPYVYRNTGTLDGNGDPTFTPPDYELLPRPAGIDAPYYAPGAPVADYDNDGKIDIFFMGLAENAMPTLWRNSTSGSHGWLKVNVSLDSNTYGLGSKIQIFDSGHLGDLDYLIGTKEISTGNGYISGQLSQAHFGLGAVDQVDILVTLPNDGGTFSRLGVSANQLIELTPTSAEPTDEVDGGSSTADEQVISSVSRFLATVTEDGLPLVRDDNEVVLEDLEGFTEGEVKELEVRIGQVLRYELSGIGGQRGHTITLKEIGADYVIVTFASTPVDIKIKLGETVQRDVNEDGTADIAVTLTNLSDGVATLAVEKLTIPAKAAIQPPAPQHWLLSVLRLGLVSLFVLGLAVWGYNKSSVKKPV